MAAARRNALKSRESSWRGWLKAGWLANRRNGSMSSPEAYLSKMKAVCVNESWRNK
jgi:hypothetical protein